jgi:hypothetical protein
VSQQVFDQTYPMPAKTQNVTQHVLTKTHPMPANTLIAYHFVLTKPRPCQREHKMHLNKRWPNLSHASQHMLTKPILCHRAHKPCVDQTHLMPVSTQNAS